MRSRSLLTGFTVLTILLIGVPHHARSETKPAEPATEHQVSAELDKFLAEFDVKRNSFQDYQATFTQLKFNRLFNEFSEPAAGTLSYKKPSRALWDYRSPDKMTVLLRDQRVHMYIADMEQMEIYDFRDQQPAQGLFLGFDQTPAELREAYHIALLKPDEKLPDTYTVQLEPRENEMAAYFTSIKLWLRKTDFAVVRILIEGPEEGNLTTIDLTDISINTGIPDSTFEINVPPETAIIEHPADELQPTIIPNDVPQEPQINADER